MQRVLITGSNRGLGLEFVRQYLDDGWRVYATCRHPVEARELQRLGQIYNALSIHRLDITVEEDIAGICEDLSGIPIDLLINNAGVYFRRTGARFGNLHYDRWRRTFEVNTLGTIHVIECLEENVDLSNRDRLIVALSSKTDDLKDPKEPSGYYYRSSKAAMNAVLQGLALELKPRSIGVLLLYPGEVMTRMGSSSEGISPRCSVSGMRTVIDNFSLSRSGSLLRYDGQRLN